MRALTHLARTRHQNFFPDFCSLVQSWQRAAAELVLCKALQLVAGGCARAGCSRGLMVSWHRRKKVVECTKARRSVDSGYQHGTHPCVQRRTEAGRSGVLTSQFVSLEHMLDAQEMMHASASRLFNTLTTERGLACTAQPLASSRFQIHVPWCCMFLAESRPALYGIAVGWPASAGRVI